MFRPIRPATTGLGESSTCALVIAVDPGVGFGRVGSCFRGVLAFRFLPGANLAEISQVAGVGSFSAVVVAAVVALASLALAAWLAHNARNNRPEVGESGKSPSTGVSAGTTGFLGGLAAAEAHHVLKERGRAGPPPTDDFDDWPEDLGIDGDAHDQSDNDLY